jgi:hypothetical protein
MRPLFVQYIAAFCRGIPHPSAVEGKPGEWSAAQLSVADQVFCAGPDGCPDFGSNSAAARRLVDCGAICQIATGSYAFASPLNAQLYLLDRGQYRFERPAGGDMKDMGIRAFAQRVILGMSSETLRNTSATGGGTPLERCYQMEWYRSAVSILPAGVYCSPDVGGIFGSEGYLDFWINSKHRWGFELLRDGDRMKQHLARFQPDGMYADMLDEIKEWLVIDLRMRSQQVNKKPAKGLVHVLFASDFSECDILWDDGKEHNGLRLLEKMRTVHSVEATSETPPAKGDGKVTCFTFILCWFAAVPSSLVDVAAARCRRCKHEPGQVRSRGPEPFHHAARFGVWRWRACSNLWRFGSWQRRRQSRSLTLARRQST